MLRPNMLADIFCWKDDLYKCYFDTRYQIYLNPIYLHEHISFMFYISSQLQYRLNFRFTNDEIVTEFIFSCIGDWCILLSKICETIKDMFKIYELKVLVLFMDWFLSICFRNLIFFNILWKIWAITFLKSCYLCILLLFIQFLFIFSFI